MNIIRKTVAALFCSQAVIPQIQKLFDFIDGIIYLAEIQKCVGLKIQNQSDCNYKIYRTEVTKSIGLCYAFLVRGDVHGQDHE